MTLRSRLAALADRIRKRSAKPPPFDESDIARLLIKMKAYVVFDVSEVTRCRAAIRPTPGGGLTPNGCAWDGGSYPSVEYQCLSDRHNLQRDYPHMDIDKISLDNGLHDPDSDAELAAREKFEEESR